MDTYQPAPPPVPPAQPLENSTLAVVSLITGILGWVGLIGVGPIIAIITGHMAKNEIRSREGMMGGDGMATAGLILGYTNLALSVVIFCLAVVLPLMGIFGFTICGAFSSNMR